MNYFREKNRPLLFALPILLLSACTSFYEQQNNGSLEEKPDESYFEKIVLDDNLDEPMELVVTPEGRVIFIERYGNIKLYDPEKQETSLLVRLEVNAVFSHGLLGITLDPDFKENNWVYIFYSPVDKKNEVQRVSRFKLRGDDFLLNTEQVIIEIPVQRKYHGHDGGSLAFGPDGNLYIAIGDNTSPFFPDSKTPLDEQPGKSYFDAQRTSANTNDLNGKILRIRPRPDGGYSIPEGNLFPEGQELTRPEIFVMGCRNPFRISVDQKTGYLYVGNIGGVDEVYQVNEAGFYGGWPYFFGDNQVYDLTVEVKGPELNPNAPVNNSPNNTGLKELPPCQPSMLWYSDEKFPLLGGRESGKNIMAGPVYRSSLYPENPRKFPEYYNGKLFIYDWARNWIIAVKFDEDNNYKEMEPFMPSSEFSRPMDLEFGPDGALYLLEYGSAGYAQNKDARLARIEFSSGNRKPKAHLSASRTAGAAPLEVEFSAKKSFDYDKDDVLSFAWHFTSSGNVQSTEIETSFVFEKAGIYEVELKVIDSQGASSSAFSTIKVGNEPPVVDIQVDGNRSFYFKDSPFGYHVSVLDKEDGSLNDGIGPEKVSVTINHSSAGLQQDEDFAEKGGEINHFGKALMKNSDCLACHMADKTSIGPSFTEIASRYKDDKSAPLKLSERVINGGGGNWPGGQVMPPHPLLSKEEAGKMVDYMLSYANPEEKVKSLPVKGQISPTAYLKSAQEENGEFLLMASYTDRGTDSAGSLTSKKAIVLKSPVVTAANYDESHNVIKRSMYVDRIRNGSYIAYKSIDLKGIRNIRYEVGSVQVGGIIELRLDGPEGELVSEARVRSSGNNDNWRDELYSTEHQWEWIEAKVKSKEGIHDLYFIFKNEDEPKNKLFLLNRIHFQQ